MERERVGMRVMGERKEAGSAQSGVTEQCGNKIDTGLSGKSQRKRREKRTPTTGVSFQDYINEDFCRGWVTELQFRVMLASQGFKGWMLYFQDRRAGNLATNHKVATDIPAHPSAYPHVLHLFPVRRALYPFTLSLSSSPSLRPLCFCIFLFVGLSYNPLLQRLSDALPSTSHL